MGILDSTKGELEPPNPKVLNSKLLRMTEEGRLDSSSVSGFTVNQWYVVNQDPRSLALGLARSQKVEELELFKILVNMDYTALDGPIKLLNELEIPLNDPVTYDMSPKGAEYTRFLSWLYNYTQPSEFLFRVAVNLLVWNEAITKFETTPNERNGINKVGFFEVFSRRGFPVESSVERLMEGPVERLRNLSRSGDTKWIFRSP